MWELWRRLPAGQVTVLTTSYAGDVAFDAAQDFRVVRRPAPVLLPLPGLARDIDALAAEVGAGVVFLDPVLPLGALGPRLRTPYVVILHGAEVTVPARLPGTRRALARVLHAAIGVVAAGPYPLAEATRAAGRPLAGLVVPPGVDVARFRPLPAPERAGVRARFGLRPDGPLVLGVSRLVPRKGFDVLIDAVASLDGDISLALAGTGRDHRRLARRAASAGLGSRFRMLGRVADTHLAGLYGAADIFAMCCRERWGGLEAEGFGIVFLEAAACGVPAVAGASGGTADAVVDGQTGFVVPPADRAAVAAALDALLADPDRRAVMGAQARRRAERDFSYDMLAARLEPLARGDISRLVP